MIRTSGASRRNEINLKLPNDLMKKCLNLFTTKLTNDLVGNTKTDRMNILRWVKFSVLTLEDKYD